MAYTIVTERGMMEDGMYRFDEVGCNLKTREVARVDTNRFNAARLQALMDEQNISDYKLAAKTGVSRTMIYYLRTGGRKGADTEIVLKLANYFGKPVEYLMSDEDPPSDEPQLSDALRRIAEISATLSRMRQEELARIAETLANLDHEQQTKPLPNGMTRALMDLVDDVRRHGISDDEMLNLLESIIRSGRRSSGWNIDLRGGLDGPNQPGHDH
jgi:transcriptional regulator with XRE-family HTH domain